MGNTNITLPDGIRSATTDQADEMRQQQVAAGPPVNVDVPHLYQEGDKLICTMGNWEGEPSTYEYAWLINGDELLDDGDPVTGSVIDVTEDDVGASIACEVTASHSGGATTVTSNAVTVVAP